MASRARCVTCGKDKAVMKCGGCSEDFCFNHMTNHRQELSKQLDEIQITRDLFRQTLTEQSSKPQKHPLMLEIDRWEEESINRIQETAKEARQVLMQCTTKSFHGIEMKLQKLTNVLRESREENDFVETDLQMWKQQLEELEDELKKPSTVSIRHESTPFISKISVNVSASLCMPIIDAQTRWRQNGITVVGGKGRGNGIHQLYNPFGLYVDDDQTIYVADFNNHRIVEWRKGAESGRTMAGGNGQGKRIDQLNTPTDVVVDKKSDSLIICDYGNRRVMRYSRQNDDPGEIIISNIDCYGLAMDDDGYLYVSDYMKNEVKRWEIGEKNGIVVAGGHGKGNRLNQLDRPTYLCVDQDRSLYVVDQSNIRVMKWVRGAIEGIVVAGNQGGGNNLGQLSAPLGIVVDQRGTVYVADSNNHRVLRWLKGATQGEVIIGGNGPGTATHQLGTPVGLASDRHGNLYVTDYGNDRVQQFQIDIRHS